MATFENLIRRTEPEGAERAKDQCTLAPDRIGPVDLAPACEAHDGDYAAGGDSADRKAADERFRRRIEDAFTQTGKRVATVYFTAVRLLGWMFWGRK